MFNPVLHPGLTDQLLDFSQAELGELSGLCRRTVSLALKTLEGAGPIKLGYGGIQVVDPAGLAYFQEKDWVSLLSEKNWAVQAKGG